MEHINQIIPVEIAIFSAILNLLLGIYIYLFAYKLSNKRYISAKYLSYICFGIFNWVLWMIIQNEYILHQKEIWSIYITNVIIYGSFITIIQSLVFFAISLNNSKISKKYYFLNYPYILNLLLIIIPQIGLLRLNNNTPIAYSSISYLILLIYSISYLILYVKILVYKYNNTYNKNTRNIIQLFLTVPVFTFFVILTSNIIIPSILKDINFIYYGPIFMLNIGIIIFIAIFKYKLFYINISVVNLLITLIITLTLLIIRFSLIDNSRLTHLQTNIVFTLIFASIYIFLTREVYVGLKKQILLNTRRKELEIALESKNNFLQNSSHQFRTPLTVILGYLGMIINKDNPKYEFNKMVLEDLNKTYTSAKNLNEIINDVLAANDINTGKLGFRIKDRIDLTKLMQSIIVEKKELLSGKSTIVDFRTKGKNTLANIDCTKIKEALNNIFDNSIFYGKGKVDILINYELKDVFKIHIKDNGVGITIADSKKIWKKFERGKRSPQINPNGSGLGLYLAKQIINQHGGEITVESEGINKGSNFILTIPKNISLNLKQ